MSERINLQDLSALLAEKMAITKKDADLFLREYFETLNEELIKTKLIKIKDLGAFKLLWVENRESINVTTGERVLIPAHYKVTFIPDKKLAETINEPFALFEMTEIEDETGLEELNSLPDEDASEELELTPDEEEEFVFEKESNPDKELQMKERQLPLKPIFEEEPSLQKELMDEFEEPMDEFEEPMNEDEYPMNEDEETMDEIEETINKIEEPMNEDEDPIPERNPDYSRELKNPCLNCRDYEASHFYREKYAQSQSKLKQMRAILVVLAVLFIAALSYIVFMQFEDSMPFVKSSHIFATLEPGVMKDSDSVETSKTPNDSIAPEGKTVKTVETPAKKETYEKSASPAASDKSKQITVLRGQSLRSIALKEYGDKAFWVYIYLENRDIISEPDMLSAGVKITIPAAGKYGIDSNDPASIQKAKDTALKYP